MRLPALLLCLALAACGQAGDLYLPDAKPAPQGAPAPATAPAPDATPDRKDKP